MFRAEDVAAVRTDLERLGVPVGKLCDGPDFSFFDGREPAGTVFQVSSRP